MIAARFHQYMVAMKLNNMAVTMLEAKSNKQAAVTLKDSLETMKLAVGPDRFLVTYTDESIDSDPRILCARQRLADCPTDTQGFPTTVNEAHRIEELSSQYQLALGDALSSTYPLRMELSTAMHAFNGDCSLESAVILYNLAIANQTIGREASSVAAKDVALQLYKLALTVLSDCEINNITTFTLDGLACVETQNLIFIHALYNITQISYDLGRYGEARECVDILVTLGVLEFESEDDLDLTNSASAASAA